MRAQKPCRGFLRERLNLGETLDKFLYQYCVLTHHSLVASNQRLRERISFDFDKAKKDEARSGLLNNIVHQQHQKVVGR